MALQYGLNITASDMRALLEKNDKQQSGIRTWRQLFGNASLGFNAQSDALATDYSAAIAQAYRTNFEQNNAIMNAGLNVGATKEMLAQSRNDLHAAYESYVRGYSEDVSAAAKDYAEEYNTIDTALNERAENFAKIYNSAYRYLSEELYGAQQGDMNLLKAQGMDWLQNRDSKGVVTGLRSWNNLSQELFNPDGSLNDKGTAFFDQVFNLMPGDYTTSSGNVGRTYGEWLSNMSADKNDDLYGLYDWYVGQDAFNYNFAGTNRGTANAMSGRESIDDAYNASEYKNTSGMQDFNAVNFEGDDYFQKALNEFNAINSRLEEIRTHNEKVYIEGGEYINGVLVDASLRDEDEAYAPAREAWIEYQNKTASLVNKLETFFKNKIGSNAFTEFTAVNTSLYNEYNAIKDAMKNAEYIDTNLTKRLSAWYRKLYNQMYSYLRKNSYTGKTSGF